MAKIKIGQAVWIASFSPSTPMEVLCPVCYGKRKVTLILGNGDKCELPCDYCGKGNLDIPTGYETVYQQTCEPKPIIIESIEINQSQNGEQVKYGIAHYIYQEDMVFETKKAALEKSEELKNEYLKKEQTRKEYIKANVKKSFAWNAGYHLRQVKDLQEKIVYHQQKAILCKDRAKTNAES